MNAADRPVNRPINRIGATFTALKAQGRTGLIPYVTAGDPDPAGTVALLHALAGAGADLVELGVPFSDPMADGPVIQRAVERALARGVGLRRVLAMVAEFRREDARTPVILMGYANPLERMGVVEFARQAQAAGVDGVLTVDLPPEESGALVDALAAQGVAPIFLLAPTTPAARTAAIIERAAGFLYYVSLKGVTGADTLDLASVAEHLGALRRLTALPLGVGFGVRDPETAARVAGVADAVVVGSRLVRELEQHPAGDAQRVAGDLMRAFRAAIDEADHVQCAG